MAQDGHTGRAVATAAMVVQAEGVAVVAVEEVGRHITFKARDER